MAQKKVDPKDQLKKRMQKQVDTTSDKAALFRGEKDKLGKFTTKKGKEKEEELKKLKAKGKDGKDLTDEQADLDKFFRNAEEGFRGIKAIAQQDKKPYDGLLGRVEIERVIKTTNK